MNDDERRKEVGKRIQKLRKKNKDRQIDLASKIGISKESISKIEQGKTGLTLFNLIAIAECYHVSCDYICLGIDELYDLNKITNFLSIKYHKITFGESNYEYPALEISKALLKCLLKIERIRINKDFTDSSKEDSIMEAKKEFYEDIKNNIEKNVEKNTEKIIEIHIEKDVEKNTKKIIEKNVEKDAEKNIEKNHLDFNQKVVLVREEIVVPDINKSDWTQSDLIREISKQDLEKE